MRSRFQPFSLFFGGVGVGGGHKIIILLSPVAFLPAQRQQHLHSLHHQHVTKPVNLVREHNVKCIM